MIGKTYISKKKQKLIDAYQKSDVVKGDNVQIKRKYTYPDDWNTKAVEKLEWFTVLNFVGDDMILSDDYNHLRLKNLVNKKYVESKYTRNIGANPFPDGYNDVRTINFSLDSVISSLDLDKSVVRQPYVINGVTLKEINWNPFVFDKDGNKQYYQRPFVWTNKDNQLLIESVYNGIECGRILIRHRSWKKLEELTLAGEVDVAFRDIVDGKQRLNAIRAFINDEFKDLQGNYYSDLSEHAQHKFGDHQLFGYCEMGETVTDDQVIKQFLKLNFTGKPQSQEHINHVKEIMKKL